MISLEKSKETTRNLSNLRRWMILMSDSQLSSYTTEQQWNYRRWKRQFEEEVEDDQSLIQILTLRVTRWQIESTLGRFFLATRTTGWWILWRISMNCYKNLITLLFLWQNYRTSYRGANDKSDQGHLETGQQKCRSISQLQSVPKSITWSKSLRWRSQ